MKTIHINLVSSVTYHDKTEPHAYYKLKGGTQVPIQP